MSTRDFPNLSREYVCLYHNILYQKFHQYGIRRPAFKLVNPYFSESTQLFSIAKMELRKNPELKLYKLVVPQGTIAYLKFFIIYLNDLPNRVICEK